MAVQVPRVVIKALVDSGAAKAIDEMQASELYKLRDRGDFDLVLYSHGRQGINATLYVDCFTHRLYACTKRCVNIAIDLR